jgi:hypothetical protein
MVHISSVSVPYENSESRLVPLHKTDTTDELIQYIWFSNQHVNNLGTVKTESINLKLVYDVNLVTF